MAFRTNKVPAIEERTVSGSSVSFNSAFALPLKACKVSFSATQAGSGDPSPSNPRAISGVSAIGLTANSTPVSVSLGDTRYGGELDVVRKKLVLTRGYDEFDGSIDENWEMRLSGTNYGIFRLKIADLKTITSEINQISNIYSLAHVLSTNGVVGFRIYSSDALDGDYLVVRPNNVIDMVLSDFIQLLTNTPMQVVYEYVTPIEIDLSSIPDLSSIIGNNTFSTDTGTLEITFADLQEKSASGAVATFNTALAMPLASCNIAVNAWQEGSGDPSPSNVRAIHGFSEVNATRAGKNLFDYDSITIDNITFPTSGGDYITRNGFIYHLPSGVYTISARGMAQTFVYMNIMSSDDSFKEQLRLSTSSPVWITRTFTLTKGDYIIIFAAGSGTALNISSNEFMIEAGSEATAYEPYVTPTIYTIQLGQEVYGAEVDVVNGVMNDNSYYFELDGSEDWSVHSSGAFMLTLTGYNIVYNDTNSKCNYFKWVQKTTTSMVTGEYKNTYNIFYFVNQDITSLDDWKSWLNTHNIQLVTTKTNSDEVQLTPTQIETIRGNNTIFADTGDVDLTYKDLDIAKRGNFREVFKLPS